MLDFYLIKDSETKPTSIKDQYYAGGLELMIFEKLVKKGVIDSRFNYYSDFRWREQLILQISAKLEVFHSDSDIQKLKEIVDQAVMKKSGLMAFGD